MLVKIALGTLVFLSAEVALSSVVLVRGSMKCLGEAVSNNVVLTTASCVQNLEPVLVETEGGTSFQGRAYRSPFYRDKKHDLAIIHLAHLDSSPKSINTTYQNLQSGYSIVGTDCQEPQVSYLAKQPSFLGIQGRTPNFVIAKAKTCYGMAGLGLYENNLIVGILAKTDNDNNSYYTDLSTPESHGFLKSVSNKLNLSICGLNRICN